MVWEKTAIGGLRFGSQSMDQLLKLSFYGYYSSLIILFELGESTSQSKTSANNLSEGSGRLSYFNNNYEECTVRPLTATKFH